MSALADSFLSGERVITTELRPVDDTDLSRVASDVRALAGRGAAVSVPDNPACTRRAWL